MENETQPPTRFFDLSEAQKLNLTSEQITDSIKIEAIHRGIKIPYTLEQLTSRLGCQGFNLPADKQVFYEIVRCKKYGGYERTGVCFTTAEEARSKLEGAICIDTEGYNEKERNVIIKGEWTVQEVYVTLFPLTSFATKLKEVEDDSPCEEFTKLCEECQTNLSELRQARYDAEVRQRKRAEYLRLAQGNLDIAKSFWAKAESSEFPAE